MEYEELKTELIISLTQVDKITNIILSRVNFLKEEIKSALRKERNNIRNELRFFEKFSWAYEDYKLDFSVDGSNVQVDVVSHYDNANVYHSLPLKDWLFSDDAIKSRMVELIEQAKIELKDQIDNNRKALIQELKDQLKQLEEN